MGKRLVEWTVEGVVLKIAKKLEDEKAVAVIEAEFDLAKIFPAIAEMTDVQKQSIIFGIRQKLMDTGASEIGSPDGKIAAAKKRWEELVAGKWTGERVNASARAADKKTVEAVKAATKVVSLEGLVMKKTLAGLPGYEPFTEEDQDKLDEFMAIASKRVKK